MYVLYGGADTRALLVEMVMAEGDIAYELREVDIIGQQHRTPEYLAINPAGWVPALITPQGDTLYETPAINLYLAERHQLDQLAPRTDAPERGAFLSGLFYLTDELEPALKRYFYPHRYVMRTEDAGAMKALSRDSALERLGVVDQRLREGGPYHLGERYSLVDLTATYWAAHLDRAGALEPYPALRECMDLVMQRPKLRAGFDQLKALTDE
jgi:glutathione S-transferase